MHKNLPWNGFICDNPQKFATKSIELYLNNVIWKQAQENGIAIIDKCYSNKKYGSKFVKRIDSTINNLSSHRLKNFTGALLMHHTLKSTKYLAKWIEEKNKT